MKAQEFGGTVGLLTHADHVALANLGLPEAWHFSHWHQGH
jgi:hypothetical protein